MKKLFTLLLVIAMMATISVGCSSPAGGSTEESTGKSDGIVIGLSLPTQREDIWVRHEQHIRQAAEALGGYCSDSDFR